MDLSILLWIGGAMIVIGLIGLGYCIKEAARIRGAKMAPEDIHANLRKLVVVNVTAVGIAFMGLALIAFTLIIT